jgi:hypothetical protein
VETKAGRRSLTWLLLTWGVTRLLLLLWVFKVYVFPGPDVTSDVTVIYQGWYDVLRTGTFPQSDVTWQYPPAAALAILSPALLPFLEYTQAFFLMAFAADLVALLLLLYAGLRPGRRLRGAWVWVAGVPLLGPTVYSRYDVMVTAVAVAAVLAAARHPKVAGALVGFGALLKVWPALILVGIRRRSVWASAVATVVVVAGLFAAAMPGAFAFLTFQRERGTEVESLGSLVFHIARHHGWDGSVLLNYGSVEFLGPGVSAVSTAALALTGMAFGLLLLWRLAATRFEAHTAADAALVAVLMFTTTSRVISPQYMVWLVGLAAAGRPGAGGVLRDGPGGPDLVRGHRGKHPARHRPPARAQRPAGPRHGHRHARAVAGDGPEPDPAGPGSGPGHRPGPGDVDLPLNPGTRRPEAIALLGQPS